MDVWFFTEQSNYPVWDKFDGALRGDIPNKYADPVLTSQLVNGYLDLYELADKLGMNVMVNEHHVASTCQNPSVTLTLAVIARITKNARLLGLGSIVSNRMDPLRVAEEYAVVDSISGGRLDMGLVKGAGWELFASNSNPVGGMDRLFEAHDLIVAAMTNHEGPFSWEGEHFDYRMINLWPRPVQQPHPPIWFTGGSPGSARISADYGYRNAAFLTGPATKPTFDAYRERYQEKYGKAPVPDMLAYLGMVACSRDKATIERNIRQMRAYVASIARMRPAHGMPPGYATVEAQVGMMRSPKGGAGMNALLEMSDQELADAGVMFWGEPERIHDQICAFNEFLGGFGHFFMMGQAADMSFDDAKASMTLFGERVLPELKKIDKFSLPAKQSVDA